jgi:hypothetical protein
MLLNEQILNILAYVDHLAAEMSVHEFAYASMNARW